PPKVCYRIQRDAFDQFNLGFSKLFD
ncbi:ArsR family transcriptional regulator, partial [Vibrio parahaemolyticus]|nr:ArsR family transcriptional regulator [Vibrio parahaemolyticus]